MAVKKKKKYGKGGPKASNYVGNPMGYFNDKAEFKMQEGGQFEPYLSEDKTVYYTGPNSGVFNPRGFKSEKQAERKKKRRDRKEMRRMLKNNGIGFEIMTN